MGLTWLLSLFLVYVYSFKEDFDDETLSIFSVFSVVIALITILGLIVF